VGQKLTRIYGANDIFIYASWAPAAGGRPPWIFMYGTDKVQEGLLFFGLIFPLPPKKFFLPTPLQRTTYKQILHS